MGFLTPLALVLGAAISIPIILHLFQRQQGPRMVFPALRYLRRAEREHARRIKLRQLLLLALRVLAVLLIAGIAARPFLRAGGSAHAPSAVALVLDNSASSGTVEGEQRILDVLKDRAMETLMRAGPDDQFWLLRAGSPWEPAMRGDASTIADRVRETEPTASAADLGAAVERAAALVTAGANGRALEIQLLSDLQATNLHGTAAAPAPEMALVAWAFNRKPPVNRGISDVEVGGGFAPRAGERSTIAVGVTGSDRDSVNIRLAIGGRTAGAGLAASGATAVLPLPPQPGGMLTGFAEIDADALRADNRRYFAVRVVPVPSVAVGRSLPFLDEALAVLAGAGRLKQAVPGAADAVIAPGGIGLELARPTAAVIVFPPESPVEIPGLNRRLSSAGIGWRYAAGTQTGEARFAEESFTADPLLRHLSGVQLRQTYALQPPPGNTTDSVTLRLRDGQPWAVRGQRTSGGRFVLLATPLTLQASTLPASPAMLPLFDRMLGSWSAPVAASPDVAPGEPVSLPAGAHTIVHPDGLRDTLNAGDNFRAPAEPGTYRVLAEGGNELGTFVINTSPAETPLDPVAARGLRDAFPGWRLEIADNAGQWSRDIYHQRLGREIWWPLLLGLLALLIIESIVAATGRAVRSSGTSAETSPTVTPTARTLTG